MIAIIIQFDIGLDLFPMLAAILAAVGCGLLGNFLVLRRLSLMGDAISHSVLPGLVIAFLITTTRSPIVMFFGAAFAGIITVVLVEVVKKLGRVEPGAAMGVVFSILFALGVLLIERAAVRHVDLDAECVLHGQLETLAWYGAPETFSELIQWSTLEYVPRQVTTLFIMVVVAVAFVGVFFKELRMAAFDPALATTQGYNETLLHYVLMVFVAAATVASFEAVGSILVIAMLICPAATARLMTDRLLTQIIWSVVFAIISGVAGYIAATAVPAFWNKDAVNAAGTISLAAGALLVLAMMASPRHGLVTRWLRQRRLAARVGLDDLLAALFRASETGNHTMPLEQLRHTLPGRSAEKAVATAARRAFIEQTDQGIVLTRAGRAAAADIVRKHRLWEHYLVEQAGLSTDHVHSTAEQLEHMPMHPPPGPETDPHGRIIPQADE